MMKKRDKFAFISWVLFIILIISTLFNVYLILTKGDETPIKQRSELSIDEITDHIDSSFDERFIGEEKIRGIIEEYTNKNDESPEVIHGKDGIDGKDGDNGKDGEDGKSVKGDKGDKGKDGEDGYTPAKGVDYFDGEAVFIQCNMQLNAWQKRYESSSDWELLDDKLIPCVIE